MKLGPVDKTAWNLFAGEPALLFENYWQYGKLFPGMTPSHFAHKSEGEVPSQEWCRWRQRGHQEVKGHRHPRGTKTTEVMRLDEKGRRWFRYRTAVSSRYLLKTDVGEKWCQLGYLESRKKVYVPLYESMIKQQPVFQELRKLVIDGKSLLILDYDAPETPQRVTLEFLR